MGMAFTTTPGLVLKYFLGTDLMTVFKPHGACLMMVFTGLQLWCHSTASG
jgi:hypothetical protein